MEKDQIKGIFILIVLVFGIVVVVSNIVGMSNCCKRKNRPSPQQIQVEPSQSIP